MKIILPEAAKGFKFDLLYTIDMNDFDVEMLLPMLFHMVRTKGKPVGKANDPMKFDEYFEQLRQHHRIAGFDAPRSRRLLKRWLRTSVVKIGKVGRSGRGEQILFVYPRTLLAYKAGLPKDITRLRGTHRFLYYILLENAKDPVQLENLFTACFGDGVSFTQGMAFDGRYDDKTDVDIETLLSFCFLDQLTAAGIRHYRPSENQKIGPRLTHQSTVFAQDVLALLRCYRGELSTTLLIGMTAGLINLHFFVYTMRLVRYVLRAVQGEASVRSHKLYVDCTGERRSYSDELARGCVERDLGELEMYMRASLRLRTLDRYIQSNQRLRPQLPPDTSAPEYLKKLVELQHSMEVENKAEMEFDDICKLNQPDAEDEQMTDDAQFLASLKDQQFEWSLDRTLEVLFRAHRSSALGNLGGWFYAVGGYNRTYGLISGNVRGVRVARYALTNELLSILVHAALANGGPNGTSVARMSLRDFLQTLEERYGILIDKPPAFDRSVEASEAARRNLSAFKVRLRQIGVFRSLSDDFGAQYIHRPTTQKAVAAC